MYKLVVTTNLNFKSAVRYDLFKFKKDILNLTKNKVVKDFNKGSRTRNAYLKIHITNHPYSTY